LREQRAVQRTWRGAAVIITDLTREYPSANRINPKAADFFSHSASPATHEFSARKITAERSGSVSSNSKAQNLGVAYILF